MTFHSCRAGLAVLALATGIGLAGSALAAPPQATAGNKGGQERGLDRADQRAGSHGDQGRDRAEANHAKTKTKKPAQGAGSGR